MPIGPGRWSNDHFTVSIAGPNIWLYFWFHHPETDAAETERRTMMTPTLNPYRRRPLVIKSTADYSHFDALDMRVGRVIKVADAATRKPTYRLTIDFGPEIGVRVSCGAYRNYAPGELLGKPIIGIVNFAEKKMGPEVPQVLVLGAPNEKGETIYLMPQTDVLPGAKVF
jgi:tRNA-binding protein